MQKPEFAAAIKKLQGSEPIKIATVHGMIIGQEGVTAFAKELAATKHALTMIDFSRNFLTDAQCVEIIKGIEANPGLRKSLQKLHMMSNEAKDATAEAVARVFGRSPEQKAAGMELAALQVLDISYNKLLDAGPVAIAKLMLAGNSSNLTDLFLSCNDTTDVGILALCEALRSNTTLRSLSLAFNQFGQQGIQALIDLVNDGNSTVKHIYVNDSPFPPAMEATLKKALENDDRQGGEGGGEGDEKKGDAKEEKGKEHEAEGGAKHSKGATQLDVYVEGKGNAPIGFILVTAKTTVTAARGMISAQLGESGAPKDFVFMSGKAPVAAKQEDSVTAMHVSSQNDGTIRIQPR